MKRLFDLALAAFGFLFFFPEALIFSLLIKLEDGGPVFYTQPRWGKDGKKFLAYKFRTMVPDADKKYGSKPAEQNDERVTNIGRFLRASAMDELPQLINIWKGDMSFVGPRAISVNEADPTMPYFMERHRVRPGLTGPTQIYVSRDVSLEEKFRNDLNYIKTQSLTNDLRLIVMSVWITLRGKWESREKKI